MNKDKIQEVIDNFENTDLEFRTDLKPQKENEEKYRAAKTASAFYNSNGGEIYFGITEDGKKRKVVGLKQPQVTENNFFTQINAKCNFDEMPKAEFLKYNEKNILLIRCPKGAKPPYKFDNRVLIRSGSNNLDATEEAIARLYRDRVDYSQDKNVLAGATIKDIDIDEAEAYIEGLQMLDEVAEGDDNLRILTNIGILKEEKQGYVPTIAGLLLFGINPQIFLQNAIIKADIKYEEDKWIDIKNISGTISNQIREAEKFLMKHVETSAKIIGFKRVEEYRVPMLALREAIINAIAHRDYLNMSGAIHLEIRKNSIKIMSPGRLLPPLTIKKILTGTFIPLTRNAIIAEAIQKSGFMERRGNGLVLIKRLTRAAGLPEPIISTDDNGFYVEFIFSSETEVDEKVALPSIIWKDENLDNDMEKILQLIERHDKVNLKILEKGLKKTRGAFSNKIKYLMDKEIIERFPPPPAKSPRAYYALHNRFVNGEIKNVDNSQKTSGQQTIF